VHVDIKRAFADGEFVITHALLTGAEPVYGPHGSKVVDISPAGSWRLMSANGRRRGNYSPRARRPCLGAVTGLP